MNLPAPVLPSVPVPLAGAGQSVKTTCPYCGVGCGIIATSTDRGGVRIEGDAAHPANYGRLCSKGLALIDTIGHEQRLLHPEIKGVRVGWDEALTAVADGFKQVIREHGPDALAFYVSGQLLTEDYYVANKLMKGFIGSANIDTNSRLCMASAVAGHKRAFGSDTVGPCYEDLEQAEVIVLIGSNLAWCHPVLFRRIEQARAKSGARLLVIDPRRTASCHGADAHLPLRPGTDAALYNGLLVYLAEHGHVDTDYVKAHTRDYAAALATARERAATVRAVAALCDLDPEAVRGFYRLFAQTEKVVSLFSMGINQSSSGVDKVNSIINAHLATGRIGKPGRGAFSITGQPNAMGGREVGGLASTLAAHMDFSAANQDRVQRFWRSPRIARGPGLKAIDLFSALHAGRIKALWIMGTNPAVSLPDADFAQAAMHNCELLVCSDCTAATDTARHADILLPALAWGEKSGAVTNSERCLSRQRAFLKPPGEARADWWIISAVARQMGYAEAFDYQRPADIFREHARLSGFENQGRRDFDISALQALDNAQYEALTPVQWPLTPARPEGAKRLFADGRFYTADQRARFVPVQPRAPRSAADGRYPLILNTGRIRDHWHTLTRSGQSARLSAHSQEPFAEIHPQTAARFGIHADDLVEIESAWGCALLRARITPAQREGEVFVPLHWNDQFSAKARINAVVNPHVDPHSGQPEYKQTPARIRAMPMRWHGFLLSRRECRLEALSYWSKVRERHNWRYEFAHESAAPGAGLRQQIQREHGGQCLEYIDEWTRSARCLWFANGVLRAALFSAEDYRQLPGRDWLSAQFGEPGFGARQRARLLAGAPGPNNPDPGPTVCACFDVGRQTVLDFIRRAPAADIDSIGRSLKAGTNCGSCRPELAGLLSEAAGRCD